MKVKTKKKVYNFSMPKVKNQLVKVLKKRKNQSSIADMISDSGLPKFQVEEAIKVVAGEYNGHLRVTESGELLYYFPAGMRNQVKGFIPGLKRFLKAFFKAAGKVMVFLFKIWIVVMLVGYFILFLAILVLAIAAAIAASAANKERSRGKGGAGLLFIVIRMFFRIWLYSGLLKEDRGRKKNARPMHKSIFAFVFGEEDVNAAWDDAEKKYILSFIQTHKGIITLEEVMAITGKEREEAGRLVNQFLIEYEGTPEVTNDGSIFYRFPELLRTSGSLKDRRPVPLKNPVRKPQIPFSSNEKKTNGWIGFFNGFNLVFSSYFLWNVLAQPATSDLIINMKKADFTIVYKILYAFLYDFVADPNQLILIVLGIVPIIFSFFFYLVPAVRNVIRKKKNGAIKKDNFRKKIHNYILSAPENTTPNLIEPYDDDERPANFVQFRQKVFDRFAAEKYADIDETGNGSLRYKFNELKREIEDVDKVREEIDIDDYAVGKTVFDSGE